MQSSEIRSRFLKFFESRSHRIVPSSSLVPANDPTLLFSNAGMNQFKDVFLGREKREYSRATSSQKCVRAGGKHNDLEQVGRTARHHTFFEMLGNFSFGDYFKKDAIPWAWELLTKEFAIPADKLYVTIFEGKSDANIPRDDEAFEIWRATGVPAERIFALGMKDNFWQMGDTGPCGPCSEIHYDMGVAASTEGHTDCKFPCECGRYVELWNLVFMQFNRDEEGKMTHLPKPSIDTGMGLERISTVLQGKLSNFETDLFRPLIDEAAALAGVRYGSKRDVDISLRIIADHARSSTFLISDGVLPSNEGRGYVLRRIMRRALYHGQTISLKNPFLHIISNGVVTQMKQAYPELAAHAGHIAKAINIEEDRFARTIREGLVRLDNSMIVTPSGLWWRFQHVRENLPSSSPEVHAFFFSKMAPGFTNPLDWRQAEFDRQRNADFHGGQLLLSANAPKSGDVPPSGLAWVPGAELFSLHDTYGFAPDFVDDVVKDYEISLDRAGYEAEMQKQRERARASWKGAEKKIASPAFLALAEQGKTVFEGYAQTTSSDCRIVALIVGGRGGSRTAPTETAGTSGGGSKITASESAATSVDSVSAGEQVEIVLDHTPFYAESGGQVGDSGHLIASGSDREIAHVASTYAPVSGLIVHKAEARDTIRVGDLVTAEANAGRRDAIRRNHTATHLLHAALRKTLGTHVKQAGSLVAPDRLRFDFSHYAGLAEQDLLDIEDLVNQHVLANEAMETQIMDIDSAVATGAMALFGEKYGDKVRVVSVGDGGYSRELCGGTHVRRTGDIGLFKIVSESSVAAGTRRIEALTGTGVLDHLRRESQTLSLATQVLKSKPGEILEAIEKLTESEKKLRKELDAQQMKRAASAAGDLLGQAREIKGVKVIAAHVEVTDRAAMRQMIDDLRGKLQSGVIVLGSAAEGRVSLIAAVTKDLTGKLDAGKIVKQASVLVEGSGGGRKDLAEAGGKNPAKLDEAVQAVPGIIEQML